MKRDPGKRTACAGRVGEIGKRTARVWVAKQSEDRVGEKTARDGR